MLTGRTDEQTAHFVPLCLSCCCSHQHFQLIFNPPCSLLMWLITSRQHFWSEAILCCLTTHTRARSCAHTHSHVHGATSQFQMSDVTGCFPVIIARPDLSLFFSLCSWESTRGCVGVHVCVSVCCRASLCVFRRSEVRLGLRPPREGCHSDKPGIWAMLLRGHKSFLLF